MERGLYNKDVTNECSQLTIVSNRLPCVVECDNGVWSAQSASGGLVSALAPVLKKRGGMWIGWSGAVESDNVDPDALLAAGRDERGFELRSVSITAEDRDNFYAGFSNEIIWPLFHSLDERCNFDPAYWKAYTRVNRKFAETVRDVASREGSFLWIHDYHLMLLGDRLRAMGVRERLGFFLHIPFPPLDIFLKLPWRVQIIRAMMAFDTIGFQTLRDRRNFTQCVKALQRDVSISGRGRLQTIVTPNRSIRVGAFPISIDYRGFAKDAASSEVETHLSNIRTELDGLKMLLGLDRLDYTKGITPRLKAFRRLLDRSPELRGKVRFVQVVVPSRTDIPSYRQQKEAIEELVGEINGKFSTPGWVPIHYTYRSMSRAELLANYRAADVALVTSLNDGMNLVAKEYCAANIDETGVLVLSEFAGAAAEMHRGAVLINPYDVEGTADAIVQALCMPEGERRERMSRLRRLIRQHDIGRWVDHFLAAGDANPAPIATGSAAKKAELPDTLVDDEPPCAAPRDSVVFTTSSAHGLPEDDEDPLHSRPTRV